MVQGSKRIWSEAQKSLLIAVSLAAVVALATTVVYTADVEPGLSSSSFLEGTGDRSRTKILKQRLEWAQEAALSAPHPPLPIDSALATFKHAR